MKTFKYTMHYTRGSLAGQLRQATAQFESSEEFWQWIDRMNDRDHNFYVAAVGEVNDNAE